MMMADSKSIEAIERLKISTLATGLRVDAAALARLGGAERLTVHEYATTGGIPLRLGDVFLNVPFDEWFCNDADVELTWTEDGNVVLFHEGLQHVVDEVFPLPGYVGRDDGHGERVDDVAFSHMDRVRLSPITGCAYDCAFCDLPGRVRLRPLDQLLRAAQIALDDPVLPSRHLLISGGSPGPRDEARFADILCELVETLGTRVPVDVMMSSGPGTARLVERLVAAGVTGFALNIEIESNDASMVHIRGKHRRARPHFDETVSTAVSLLGRTGAVRSLILPGLEPLADTLAGVEHIASLGSDPVLSPFRPARNTKLAAQPPVSAELLRSVLDESRTIVRSHGVALGPRCVPCQHNTLTFPWDV